MAVILMALSFIFSPISYIVAYKASDMSEPFSTFVAKVRTCAANYGTKTVSESENGGKSSFVYVPDENDRPIAVLKAGDRANKEAFISFYARQLELDNVAISVMLDNLKLKNQEASFKGLVEEYVQVRPEANPIPEELDNFIKKYTHNYNMNLRDFLANKSPTCMEVFLKYLDVDSTHKFFSYVILMYDRDSDPKNIALQLNKQHRLEMRIFDIEHAFASEIKESLIFYMPFACCPFSTSVREIIFSWTSEKLNKAKEFAATFDGWHKNQQNRVKAFQKYLTSYAKATPLNVMLFGFFNLHDAQSSICGTIYTQGTNIVPKIQPKTMNKWGILNNVADDFQGFFTGELKDQTQGFVAAIVDYNESKENDPSANTLEDFIMHYIPSSKHFKIDKLNEFKIFFKDKFQFDF